MSAWRRGLCRLDQDAHGPRRGCCVARDGDCDPEPSGSLDRVLFENLGYRSKAFGRGVCRIFLPDLPCSRRLTNSLAQLAE